MLRQDSIHSADIRSKGSPFRAKCHEIFCCPLKQVVHKESSEPEGLFTPPSHFDTPNLSHLSFLSFPLYGLISFSASRLSALLDSVCCVSAPPPCACKAVQQCAGVCVFQQNYKSKFKVLLVGNLLEGISIVLLVSVCVYVCVFLLYTE